ncbi:MAG: secretion protein [Prevotella sp.]|nr:secretion protein [Prevotella sp.]
MKKFLLLTMLSLTLTAVVPAVARAERMIEIIETGDIELDGITVSINRNVLHVSGAAGQTLQIYKITGVGVMSVKVDSDDKYYTLDLAKGCYIVKIGKIARKISIV